MLNLFRYKLHQLPISLFVYLPNHTNYASLFLKHHSPLHQLFVHLYMFPTKKILNLFEHNIIFDVTLSKNNT